MPKVLVLFPDTNIFVQCRPLEELDWSVWGEADEVRLIVSRPVQSEIDEHKNKGGDRLARRARRASGLLRDMIVSDKDYLLVRKANPVVKLFIRPALRPSQDLAGVLDYSRNDDQLVGVVRAFEHQNPGADTRVLTHDTGPMASAKMVGVAFAPVPDDWLLPPEPSDADKRIRSLEADVAKLKEVEPQFSIVCTDTEENNLEKMELELVRYEALTPIEMAMLVENLKQRFPLATNFGSHEPAERLAAGTSGLFGIKQKFTPATDAEIKEYREKYEEWLRQSEAALRDLHETLENEKEPEVYVLGE